MEMDLLQRIERLELAVFKLYTGPANNKVEEDLDGQYGDPTIRLPRLKGGVDSWEEFREEDSKPFSQSSAKCLEKYAGYLEWKAGKNAAEPGREKYAAYDRKDAARARGWAERIKKGYKPEAEASENDLLF